MLRIHALYYGWRMALYIAIVFLGALIATAVILHYAFALFGILAREAQERVRVRRGTASPSTTRFS